MDLEEAFPEVTSYLNINSKPATLHDLKMQFTSSNVWDDFKNDKDDDLTQEDDLYDCEAEAAESVYHKEQFLTFMNNTLSCDSHRISSRFSTRFSTSRLSKSIMSPRRKSVSRMSMLAPVFEDLEESKSSVADTEIDNHKDYVDKLASATAMHMTMNIFADPQYICCKNKSNIKWQFGFVQIATKWRPEFIEVIEFKQFNLQIAAEIFNNSKPFTTHKEWKNIYWFFDNRSIETKRNQKNSISGMKQYLNDYKDGIILTFNHKHDITNYTKEECFGLIADDSAINKSMLCGVLRAYCRCDVIEWKRTINKDTLMNHEELEIICISCDTRYVEHTKYKHDCYWIEGIVKKHDNAQVFLCGKCIIQLVIEGTDKERVNIFEYLTDSLANNHKITELCLVHRLFTTSYQLMELLINSFSQNWQASDTAGMLKVINFVIKWSKLLWFEDFRKESRSRILLNRFISFLLEQTNGKKEHLSIYKATQKLIKTYRDQNLLQQQINAELQVNLKNSLACDQLHISSRVMLQNLDASTRCLSIESDESDSDDDDDDADNDDIPVDLQWFDAENEESKQKFFKYILQKRNSIDMFREYESNELHSTKKSNKVHSEFDGSNKRKSNLAHLRTTKSLPNENKRISKKMTEAAFLQEHCHEFAQQFTLIAFDLFRAIRPTELLCKAWTKKDKHITAPNIAELIIFMESMTVWAKFEISVAVREYRQKTVSRMCRIGIELLKLGNQYGAVQIYLSLVSADLKYFRHDLEILQDTDELKEFMNNIRTLLDISRNHASLRRKLWNLSSPAIPYLGVFLKDAFQADELLTVSKLQKVNPKQMALLYAVYDKIEIFRTGSYSKTIKRNDVIINYIHKQLHRAKQLNVKALSRFCKQQSASERGKKKSLFSF